MRTPQGLATAVPDAVRWMMLAWTLWVRRRLWQRGHEAALASVVPERCVLEEMRNHYMNLTEKK
jgi:hypothetical protein